MFENRKIPAFTRRISDLPDQPQLSASEMKACFDSSPEELRVAVNGLADDGAALETKVNGIITQSFDQAVTETMLSDALRVKLDGKVDSVALAGIEQSVADETAARTAADAQLQTQINAVSSTASSRARISTGIYTGNGAESRTIPCGIYAQLVIVVAISMGLLSVKTRFGGYTGGMGPANGQGVAQVTTSGFLVSTKDFTTSNFMNTNENGRTYFYMAFA